jgi:hypothetical protein
MQSCTLRTEQITARSTDPRPKKEMEMRKVLVIATSLIGLSVFSAAKAERIGPNEKCAYSWAACQSNSVKCSDPKKCQARCDEKNRQCLVNAGSRGGNRTTNSGGAAGTGVGNTKNIPGTKTGVNTNAGAATGSTIGGSGAKSAPIQQMPISTNPAAGSGAGTGQPSRSRRM